jgi:predicted DNA-binding transcriptional regulator AlpA
MSDNSMQSQFVTCSEFMAVLGISKATLNRYRRAGTVYYSQPGGKRGKVLIPRSEIERLKQAGPSANTTTPKKNRLAGPRPAWLDDEVGPDENGTNPV